MSFNDVTDLSSNVATFMARSDLTSVIPSFIALAETEFNRKLRTRQQEVTQATTPSSAVSTYGGGAFSLPSDYLTWKNVHWASGGIGRTLEYVNVGELAQLYPDIPAANPRVFAVIGTTDQLGYVQLMPTDNSVVQFSYYQKIQSLTTTTGSTVNWLLTAHPDVYLAGAMTEACVYTKDWDTAGIWKTRRDALLDEIIELDKQTRGPSRIRVAQFTP